MQIRLILFLPVAALIAALLLTLASSILSALEAELVPETAPAIKLVRYESTCAAIQRQVEEMARAATSCEADPSCLVSPIVCPVVMDEARELEYERLRDTLEDECGIVRTASYRSSGRTPYEAEICGVSAEAGAARSGEPAPETFVF
jgi:hypothetical protein